MKLCNMHSCVNKLVTIHAGKSLMSDRVAQHCSYKAHSYLMWFSNHSLATFDVSAALGFLSIA